MIVRSSQLASVEAPQCVIEAVEITRSIHGYMLDTQVAALAMLAKDCDLFIEVGTYHGKTTKALAYVCPGNIIGVDHFSGDPAMPWMAEDPDGNRKAFVGNMESELASGKVRLIDAATADAAAILLSEGIQADCIFIDADHTYEGCRSDIINFLPLVKPGGLLCGHDYGVPGFGVERSGYLAVAFRPGRHDYGVPGFGVERAVVELLPGHWADDTIWRYAVPE